MVLPLVTGTQCVILHVEYSGTHFGKLSFDFAENLAQNGRRTRSGLM